MLLDKDYFKKEFTRLHSKLDFLIKKQSPPPPPPPPSKETWVGVGIIVDVTGWNRRTLEKARRNKIVRFRRKEGTITALEYLLESVDPMFLKEQYRSNEHMEALRKQLNNDSTSSPTK